MSPKHLLPAIAGASILFAPSLQAGSYDFTDIGALMGDANSYGTSINNSGKVVGWSDIPGSTPQGPLNPQAFLYSAGAISRLDALSGSFASDATGINNFGQIAGSSDYQAYVANPAYGNGSKQPLPMLNGGAYNSAMGINDSGTVVGYSDAIVDFQGTLQQVTRAFSVNSDGTGIKDLGTLGGLTSFAFAINSPTLNYNVAKVVGASDTDGGLPHAFSVNPDGTEPMMDLGTLCASSNNCGSVSWANAVATVDTSVLAVGQSYLPGDAAYHAFQANAEQTGTMVDLGTLGGTDSAANGINAFGDIVGFSDTPGDTASHAFLILGGTMLDLNEMVLNNLPQYWITDGWYMQMALAINDQGQITGTAYSPSQDVYHAFLLTPSPDANPPMQMPEPASGWLLLSGLAGIRLAGKGASRTGR